MTTYYHGGHIGDVIYSLYTVMKNGGGCMALGPGQKQAWGFDQMRALLPLIEYQEYISSVQIVSGAEDTHLNFSDVKKHFNKPEFWGWDGRVWPGNCQLKYRYYNVIMRKKLTTVQQLCDYDACETWLAAPYRGYDYDVVFHAPLRKNENRSQHDWINILDKLAAAGARIAIIGDYNDINEWPDSKSYVKIIPTDLLHVASMLNGCALFLGLPSCNYVIAEGLGIFRLVDMTLNSESAKPTTSFGWDISSWNFGVIIDRAVEIIDNKLSVR